MAYIRKTITVWLVLANYGYGGGFEEIEECTTRKEALFMAKEHRTASPNASYTIKSKRVRKE